MKSYENQTVGNIAAENPASVRVFEKLGIDYCCGGKVALNDACKRVGIPLDQAVSQLNEAENQTDAATDRNWNHAKASDLIGHITQTHHAYVRQEIPRIEELLSKVKNRHGAAHPEVAEIEGLFHEAAEELQAHMMREEQVLFPYIAKFENAALNKTEPPQAPFPSVDFPIRRMLADHEDAGELFDRMRALSSQYTCPGDACMTYKALYNGMREFEQNLHQHIHLENNILFPRAIALEHREVEGRVAVQ